MNKILIATQEEGTRHILEGSLRETGYRINLVTNAVELLDKLEKEYFSLVLLDLEMAGIDTEQLMETINQAPQAPACIILTDREEKSRSYQILRRGAYDYLCKPLDGEEVKVRVEKALATKRMVEAYQNLKLELEGRFRLGETIVGQSPAMQEIYRLIGKVSVSPQPVLIMGEKGTGRELLARTIHFHGPRSEKGFVRLDLSTIPPEQHGLVIWGEGDSQRGKLEEAHQGTLFLKEVDELNREVQPQLASLCPEEGKVPEFDVRLIAASTSSLEEKLRCAEFYEDLFKRLSSHHLKLPPLRERKEDIGLLAIHFLSKFRVELEMEEKPLDEEALRLLVDHPWPGNVRELASVIKRAMVRSSQPQITPADLTELHPESRPGGDLRKGLLFEEILKERLSPIMYRLSIEEGKLYSLIMEPVEKTLLKLLYEKTRRNQMRTARLLGINRNTLRKKLKKYGIK